MNIHDRIDVLIATSNTIRSNYYRSIARSLIDDVERSVENKWYDRAECDLIEAQCFIDDLKRDHK